MIVFPFSSVVGLSLPPQAVKAKDEIKAINNPSLEQKATSAPVQMKFI